MRAKVQLDIHGYKSNFIPYRGKTFVETGKGYEDRGEN